MKAAIIVGVIAATGGVFYTATQSVGATAPAAQIASLEAEAASARDALTSQTAALTVKVSALETANKDLSSSFEADRATLQAALDQARIDIDAANAEVTRLVELNAQTSEMLTQIAALDESNAALKAENAAFIAQNAALLRETDQMSETLAALQAELQTFKGATGDLDGDTGALTAELAAAQAEVDALNSKIAVLESNQAEAFAYIAELKTSAAASPPAQGTDEQLAALQAQILAQATTLASAETAYAEATAKMTGYEIELATLNVAIADRDEMIAELRASTSAQEGVTPEALVQNALSSCQDRTEALLAGSTINFESSLTSITAESLPVLEELAAVAFDCIANDLVLDIEGHTDSAGGEASNLLLSNGRAQAVFDFFAARDVPGDHMRAVGFGETDPIADNATPEGRADNRRIVFDWAQR